MNDTVAESAEGAEVEPAESTQVEPAPEGDEVGTPLPDTRPPEEREGEPEAEPAPDNDEQGADEEDGS